MQDINKFSSTLHFNKLIQTYNRAGVKCPFSGNMHVLEVWARITYLWPVSAVQLKREHAVTQLWESSHSSNNAPIHQQRVCSGMVYCWMCDNTNIQLFASARSDFWPSFIINISIGTYGNIYFTAVESTSCKLSRNYAQIRGWGLHSSGMLHGIGWQLATNVLQKHISTKMLITSYQPMPCNIPEERHLNYTAAVDWKLEELRLPFYKAIFHIRRNEETLG